MYDYTYNEYFLHDISGPEAWGIRSLAWSLPGWKWAEAKELGNPGWSGTCGLAPTPNTSENATSPGSGI